MKNISIKYLETGFEQSAARVPDHPAIDDGGATVSYAELDARANKIAHYLITEGVERNDRVCFLTAKNANAYAAVLGILKSGAAWVPLGMGWPAERTHQLLRIIEPKFIICESETLDEAREARDDAAAGALILVLSDDVQDGSLGTTSEAELIDLSSTKPSVENRSPDDLAYIIFTSGSTGAPKGVMVQHRNITQFLDICPEIFAIEDGLRFAHHSELTFDPSLFDLFYCWMTGGALVPFNKASYRINPALFIRETAVNVWFSVPSALAIIADSGGLGDPEMQSLKYLVLTGEPLSGVLVKAWHDAVADIKIFNVYGTTETAIISHCYAVPRDIDPDKPVPVGSLLPGFDMLILAGDQIVPPGEVGESVVYGSQISPGYWDNDIETSARFVRNPLDPRLPQTWYRTGDLLRMNESGLYIYAGRTDSQVKIRGHRIEIEEVEHAISRHKQVAEVAVVAFQPDGAPQQARLIAYVAARNALSPDELRLHVEHLLPRHMVPARIFIDALPLPRNNNGKIDRLFLSERAIEDEAREY